MAIKHTFQTKDGMVTKDLTPLQAIRAKCMECSNWQYNEVTTCHLDDCPLWVFRSGKSGNKRNFSDEQLKAMSDRLQKLKLNR